MKVVTFLSTKGGVGKTTLTVNTAQMLAETAREKVLIIDLDAGACATVYILGQSRQEGFERSGNTVCGLLTEKAKAEEYVVSVSEYSKDWSSNLYLVPGHIEVEETVRKIATESTTRGYGWLGMVKKAIKRVCAKEEFSYVFIDPPATFGVPSEAALAAANYFILPIIPDDFGRGSFRHFISDFFNKAVVDIKSELGVLPLCGGIVFNRVKTRTEMEKIADEIREEVSKKKLYGQYSFPLYKTRLHDYIAYTKSVQEHVPLRKVKDKKAVKEFEEFFEEFYNYVVKDKAVGDAPRA